VMTMEQDGWVRSNLLEGFVSNIGWYMAHPLERQGAWLSSQDVTNMLGATARVVEVVDG